MKIIMANKFHRQQGGCETVYLSEIEKLKQHGNQVAEFSMHEHNSLPSDYSSYFADEVDYSNNSIVSKIKSASKVIYNFDARNKLKSLLNDFSPDVFHAHNIYHQLSPSIFEAAKKAGVPSILTSHDLKLVCPNYKMYVNNAPCEKCIGGAYFNCLVNKCSKGSVVNSAINTLEAYTHKITGAYQKVDRIICPSEFNAKMLYRAGYDEDRVSVLPNGIKVPELNEQHEKHDYILYVGRITQDKGVADIIDVARRFPKIKFKLAGDGPERKLYEELSLDLKNVDFLGFLGRSEVDRLISHSLCVVVSSLLYENCPMAILESMSLGKVVIASNIGGIPEIITNGENGFLYNNGDISTFSDAIDNVIKNPGEMIKIEQNARATIEKKYSEDKHISGLLKIYKDIL